MGEWVLRRETGRLQAIAIRQSKSKNTEIFNMFRKNFVLVAIIAATLLIGTSVNALAFDHKTKRQATFTVRVENISPKDGLVTAGDAKYPFALSPGMFVLSGDKNLLFKEGKKASMALESQAEDGDPGALAKALLTTVGSINLGIFNKPVGSDMAAPILPGGAYEFSFSATEGQRVNIVAMFGQSNDLFYAPAQSIELFDSKGNALSGDITGEFQLWDAGTEVNEAPGIGSEQAPRQKMKNSGPAENGAVHLVKDGFMYPATKDVLRITITADTSASAKK